MYVENRGVMVLKNVFVNYTAVSAGSGKLFAMENMEAFVIHCWYYGCLWLGDTMGKGISSHCIDLFLPKYSMFSNRMLDLLKFVVNSEDTSAFLRKGIHSRHWNIVFRPNHNCAHVTTPADLPRHTEFYRILTKRDHFTHDLNKKFSDFIYDLINHLWNETMLSTRSQVYPI